MKNCDCTTEIILFYIDDNEKQIESILPVFSFNNKNISPSEMLKLCVGSISINMPSAKIKLVTNRRTLIHEGISNLEIIYSDDISHEKLIFDLHRFRYNYIKSKINKCCNLIFTDIDTLINDDLSKVFQYEFDIATSIDPKSNLHLNARGLPIDGSLMFNFTGGIYFIKCNKNVIEFYEYFINVWENFSLTEDLSNYGSRAAEIKTHFLRWWGELHTLSVLFGRDVLCGAVVNKFICGTNFLFLPEMKYNFAPPQIFDNDGTMSINLPDLKNVSMIHFRGGRKIFMPIVYKSYLSKSTSI